MSAIFQTGFSLERGTSGPDTSEKPFMPSRIRKQMQNVPETFPSIFDYSIKELFFNKLVNRSIQSWFKKCYSICWQYLSFANITLVDENIYEWWNFQFDFNLNQKVILHNRFVSLIHRFLVFQQVWMMVSRRHTITLPSTHRKLPTVFRIKHGGPLKFPLVNPNFRRNLSSPRRCLEGF